MASSFFYLSSPNDNDNNNKQGGTDTSPSEIYAAASTGVLELWPQREPVSSSPATAVPAAPGGSCYDAIGHHFGATALLAGHAGVGGHVRGRSGMGASSGGMNCLDCGNQAKKQCSHMRCRTCCKSRGFECETHVKSTWVPAAKRREKQQMQLQLQQRGRSSGFHMDFVPRSSCSPSKRHREIIPSSTFTQGLEVSGTFPEEVSTTALLRCVRLGTAEVAGEDEEYAYQAAVSIGGHVFKGLLYDQGGINADAMARRYNNSPPGESSSGGSAAHPSLNLITPAAPSVSADVVAGSRHTPSTAVIDPSLLFPAPLNAFMTGTQFFPPPPRS
ncbi:hypothetical protein MLD38_000785 [Melastoma candidum]|uniref:Uncharacterized protein n=1 Tax=Melastoma candidum TaxID=119954 RepID=A0ACB9SCS7_9MYRT|nr:hypothetical protein MLD38_000785 [Melastoma candidum]